MEGKITICKYICTLIDGETKSPIHEFSVTGTAKCSPNDILDADYGRKLADSRAKLSAYKIASNIISPNRYYQMVEQMDKMENTLNFIDTMLYLKKKEQEHIEFLNNEK